MGLDKDQARERLNFYLNEGISPDRYFKSINKKKKVKDADSDPKLPHNVESAGFKGGSVKGDDVIACTTQKAAANSNSGQSPLAAG